MIEATNTPQDGTPSDVSGAQPSESTQDFPSIKSISDAVLAPGDVDKISPEAPEAPADTPAKVQAAVKAPTPEPPAPSDDLQAMRAEMAAMRAEMAAMRQPPAPPPPAPSAKAEPTDPLMLSLHNQARAQLPKDAADGLVTEYANLLQRAYTAHSYLTHQNAEYHEPARKELVSVQRELDRVQQSAQLAHITVQLQERDKAPNDPEPEVPAAFNRDEFTAGLLADFAKPEVLEQAAQAFPNLKASMDAGLLRLKDDLPALVSSAPNQAAAEATIFGALKLADLLFSRLELPTATQEETPKPEGSPARAAIDPSSIGLRRDEPRREPTDYPTLDSLNRAVVASFTP